MAFAWNWRGSQDAYDAYRNAEDIASKRYWEQRDYEDAMNRGLAEQSAMRGMRGAAMPAPVYGQPDYGQAAAAYQAGLANAPAAYEAREQEKQDMQAQARQDALMAELANNEQRIAQLKLEISRVQGDAARDMDELDMKLAANRARAGDIGNAISHQNRIVTRQQLAAANNDGRAADKDAEALVESYIDTQSAMMMGDNSQRPGYQNKLNYIKYQIDKNPKAKQLLEKFQGGDPGDGGAGPERAPKTFQDFTNFVSDRRAANADNVYVKNGLTNDDRVAIALEFASLPKEVQDAHRAEFNDILNKEDTIDKVESRQKALVAKQKAALGEVKADNIRVFDLADKDSYTATASNGLQYTVTRTKGYPDGTYDYIVKCGKQTKTIRR